MGIVAVPEETAFMRISYVEISNFRKLLSVRVDLADHTTLFVGANNAGKTSAMLALRRFLVENGKKFRPHDFTLSHWSSIINIGKRWLTAKAMDETIVLDAREWTALLPALDLWLEIEDGELHYVSDLIPTLDWTGGLLGVRMRLEPIDLEAFYKDYLAAASDAQTLKMAATVAAKVTAGGVAEGSESPKLTLWPDNLTDFLGRRLMRHFAVRSYRLDPTKIEAPKNHQALPQDTPADAQPLEGNPLAGLVRINEINAQRGFGETDGADVDDGLAAKHDSRRLSDQLRSYYAKHLDPSESPDSSDLGALQAIEAAQDAFNLRLGESFAAAFTEVEGLGYPGVTDPRLKVSTRLRPMDALNHEAAVSFEVDVLGKDGEAMPVLRLPEDSNGLGYQNLISMIFRLMSFRDAWMRIGKAWKAAGDAAIEPLHLVLVEEPEAHLHAQVQQVFIKKAYEVLRKHHELGDNRHLSTQLVVSTHSSHVAHEIPFSCLRYFRRLPAGAVTTVPVSTVANLSEVFGKGDETERFVTRYLRAQHADLFFADAAILVEGPVERMLLPNFIRAHYRFLNLCYITLLEIGGSHAHQLRPLIEHLGLQTLIITDLDAGRESDRMAVPSKRGEKQRTNNTTLKEWAPKIEGIDELLDASDDSKVLMPNQTFAVRVAYQTPITAKVPHTEAIGEALASTFEDALAFENLNFFSTLDGYGLVQKFREAITTMPDLVAIGQSMFDSLRNGKKAEFALELIGAKSFDLLKVPGYIAEGLGWLEESLRKKQVEILLPAQIEGGKA